MGKKLYVGNLPYDVTEDQLHSMFSPSGAVASARLITDRDTGQPKGFGFVEMGTDAEAQAAITKLNGTMVGNRKIVVNEARPMEKKVEAAEIVVDEVVVEAAKVVNGKSSKLIPLLALAAFLPVACKKIATIQSGSKVKIHYTLTVDGAVVDSSKGKDPLQFVDGSGQIIPGLEEQIAGLKAGDKKHVEVSPEKGYGLVNPAAVQKIPRSSFKDMTGLKVGSVVSGQQGGRVIQAKITKMDAKEVTLDMNHPLAGKTLNFDIEVVEVLPGKLPAKSNPAL